MENTEMYALIGKDDHIWGFYETFEEAEAFRLNQSDPEWYCIKKVWTEDYFDIKTGRIKSENIEKA